MMMNQMDVPSLLRQMQLNMMLPSMVPLGLPTTGPTLQRIHRPSEMTTGPTLQHIHRPSEMLGHHRQGLPMQSFEGQMVAPISEGMTSPQQQMASSSQGMTSEQRRQSRSRMQRRRDSRSPRSWTRSRSHRRRRSARHHRRHRGSRRRGGTDSESELDVDSIRLAASHYLTRDFSKNDTIPSACLMIRKLPRVSRPYFFDQNFFVRR